MFTHFRAARRCRTKYNHINVKKKKKKRKKEEASTQFSYDSLVHSHTQMRLFLWNRHYISCDIFMHWCWCSNRSYHEYKIGVCISLIRKDLYWSWWQHVPSFFVIPHQTLEGQAMKLPRTVRNNHTYYNVKGLLYKQSKSREYNMQ